MKRLELGKLNSPDTAILFHQFTRFNLLKNEDDKAFQTALYEHLMKIDLSS